MLPDKVLERRLDTLTRNMNEITAIIQPTTINSAAVEEEGPILSSEAKDISSLEPFCHNIRITSGKIYDFAIRSGYTEIAAYAQPLMSTETVVTQSSQADVLLEFKRNEQRSNSHHLSEDEIQEAAIDGAQEKINFLEMALQQQVCENQALNARVAELEATLEAEKSANGRLIRDLEGELSLVNARYHQLLRGQEATLQQITNHCRSRWTNSSNVFPSSDRVEEQPEVLLDGKAIGYDGKF
jgi:hypothetical protein